VPWEQTLPRSRHDDPEAWEITDFTFPSPYVDVPTAIQEYARRSFPAGRPIGEAAIELMHRIYADFTYKFGSTTLSTKVSDLLDRRSGVCQDYAHFMVAGPALARTGRALRQRLPGDPAGAGPAAASRGRRQSCLGRLLDSTCELALPGSDQRPRYRRSPHHARLGPRLWRRPPGQGCDLHGGEEVQDGGLGRYGGGLGPHLRGRVSVSHAAWDVRTVHGMHAMYSVSFPRCVGNLSKLGRLGELGQSWESGSYFFLRFGI
jgi:hypothetical protein